MNRAEALRQGMNGLASHKLRSLLTTLGIIFGVAAVIAMLGIGEGAKREALAQFESLGIDNILVLHHDLPNDAVRESELSVGLSRGDARALAEVHPLSRQIVPLRIQEEEIQAGRDRVKAQVVGTTPVYLEVLPVRVAEGRFFHYGELESAERVCVLGGALRRELFPLGAVLGNQVKVGEDWYTVIGVMHSVSRVEEDESGAVRDAGRDLYIPLSAALLRFERGEQFNELNRIVVQVRPGANVDQAAGLVETVLSRRHAGTRDYSVVVPVELIRQRQATSRIFNLVMGAIAGISLLVGGIGIMNIMLASVLERTREIGIRRAMGATQADVLAQFLMEAVAVSFIGGLIGVGLGIGLTRGIAVWAGWSTVVSLPAIALAFGVSAMVGIVFGWYPARRAARLSPIECLRYE